MAHTPANYDMSLWKGNHESLSFHFADGSNDFDLTGSTLIWRAAWSGGSLEQEMDIEAGTGGNATLSLTFTQTRTLSTTKATSYEIERRIEGEETTLVSGCITVMDGINDDSGDH